jgi:hypothetical protein
MLFTFCLEGFAQVKYEKESRLKNRDVPAMAKNFVDSMHFDTNVKWYKETGFSASSIEAKTKFNGKSYSIEFSEDGSFEDIEIEIVSNDLPSETFDIVSRYLSERHPGHAIEKIQVQYSGNPTVVLDYFQNKKSDNGLVINFEVVISCKLDGSFTMIEYLFSWNGEFIKKAPIVLQRSDNIEF